MTFSLAHCDLVTLLVTVGQLRPRLAAFDNVLSGADDKRILTPLPLYSATTQLNSATIQLNWRTGWESIHVQWASGSSAPLHLQQRLPRV